jgi:sulfate transport system ATP-binding protein
MSVLDNVAFGLRVRSRRERPSSSEIRERARTLLDLVQLSGLERRFPAQLSGGQRQRVALARALAIEPRVLLLDEPFGALDAKVRKELRRWLREIHDRTGHTTLFVTHDQEEALELADRIVVMNDGRIEQVGTPDEIYDRPASAYVFGFIGESSALPVAIKGGRILVDDVDAGLKPTKFADGPGRLYLRPHDIDVDPEGASGLAGRIVATRRHGAVRRAEIAVGRDGHRIEFDLPAAYDIGTRASVAIRPRLWEVYPGA